MLIRLLGGKIGGRDIEVDQNRIIDKAVVKFDGEFFLFNDQQTRGSRLGFIMPVFERIEPPFEVNNGSVGIAASTNKGD